MKILLVEHDAVLAMLAEEALTQCGHDVQGPARTGDDALRIAATLAADVAVVSIGLQGADDGLGVSRELQQRFHIPCILVRGPMGAASDYQQAASALLSKPYSLADLDKSVRCVKAAADGEHVDHAAWPPALVIFPSSFEPSPAHSRRA